MATVNNTKENLIVWMIVAAVFTALTILAINFDHIRHSPLFQ